MPIYTFKCKCGNAVEMIVENSDKDLSKYKALVKLFDQAEIINDLV